MVGDVPWYIPLRFGRVAEKKTMLDFLGGAFPPGITNILKKIESLKILNGFERSIHQPPYLASLLHFFNVPRQLRSSTSQQLSIPRTKLNLGKRAFSVAAPIIWNELPTTLKSCESLASFRKNLKTYLFKIAFPP